MFDTDVIALPLPRSATDGGTAPEGDGRCPDASSPLAERVSTSTCDPVAPPTDFIVGPENRLAGAAALWLLGRAKRTYSPLVLHGPSGSGKTHLALGIARARDDVVAVHGADFVREIAVAIDHDTMADLRRRYRSAGMLVLEDLTDLVGHRVPQRELLNTIDAMELRDAPVVVTSRRPPAEIADLLPGLRSRLSGGMTIALSPPGVAARVEIVQRLAKSRQINLQPAAAQLLAENISGPASLLHGAIVELIAHGAPLQGNTLGLDDVHRFLATRRTRLQPDMPTIVKVVAKYFGVKPAKLSSPSRSRQVSLARGIAIYLGRQLTGQSLKSLGKHFGNRDHTTVLYNYRKLAKCLESDAELQKSVADLQSQLNAA